ncbi:polysaccharide biosynthesis/export family protein [Fuerstiella marisgermanici]|uniref:Polysaccharide biosynthesis/export protein n=1 Tax=Fuerstiella marisgermanici TaxID=1891926 RepID=A0A1P8WAS2_9PLAN|nr:polysaccharide biosynthesis/export family protein [Fuerstiella marisgermanici]APZ91177.1 Polysaccharide biosynthesis/export protein [Fuerstiella marisgermanici]
MTNSTTTTQPGRHQSGVTRRTHLVVPMLALLGMGSFLTGCSTITGVPVSRVPKQLLTNYEKDDFQDISMLRLRQDPPEFYALGPGDVLGVFVKGVLGDEDKLPPVHYPENSSLPPAVGYPTPVREDGTLSLPIIKPVNVEGLSLIEATEKVRQAYIGGPAPILPPDSQVDLTMIRRRTVRVLVIREESGAVADVTKRGTGHVVDLPAYENDVLHALSETGGMPGLDAENQVLIYRGMFKDGMDYDRILNSACIENCHNCEDNCFCDERPMPDPPNVTRIPLRYHPTEPPQFEQNDILLSDGDIIIIRSRDSETFFTAGLLGGGEHLLPRDKDLDVLGAIAMAGGPLGNGGTGISAIGAGARGGFGGGTASGSNCQPSQVIVIRELPCGNQISIKIDLNRALQNPSERILIQPNDVVMLRYKLSEEVANVFLQLLPSYLIGNGLRR